MQRFDVRGTEWNLQKREDGLGAFCWAEEALHYRKQYHMALIATAFLIVVSVVLFLDILYHQADPVPAQPAAISAEQYEQALQDQRQLQTEIAVARKKIADLKAKSVQLEKMIKTQNVTLQQREQQLKELAVSVPTQPIILQGIQQEVKTEAGLRKVVARQLGAQIAGRLQVKE